MTISSIPKLFQPIRVGTVQPTTPHCDGPDGMLLRRCATRPWTSRSRILQAAHECTWYPDHHGRDHYRCAGGRVQECPWYMDDEQISGWLKVCRPHHFLSPHTFPPPPSPSWQIVDALHTNCSLIFLQLQALGRTASPDVLQEGGYPLVAPSPIPLPLPLPPTKGKNGTSRPSSSPPPPPPVPRALIVEECEEYVQLYATAARNAVLGAGFDGVEIHLANGYLPDYILQSNSNRRTDFYGGSVQNRVRFVLEVTEAIVKAVGADRVGIRLSPWATYCTKE